MDLFQFLLIPITIICMDGLAVERSHVITSHNKNSNKNKKMHAKGVFLNTWAVVVHGDEHMANKVAAENGFINKGKKFQDVYEFVHRGIPKRRKRASFVKTMHLTMDTRVVWAQQQESKIRKKRSISFNDERWKEQWYLHREDDGFKGHDMNVLPVWEKGITGKGIVVSILDDGIEYTHPELKENYDQKASYDYNDNDTDPMPRDTWREENRHGTRCAAEVAAAANNSKCIVGVAYGSKIGGIRMLDGEITDMVEAQSLQHARDHIDIYSSSWGPEDDGMTVDGPGTLTKKALRDGAKWGRQGKGSIVVWASGNGGSNNDHCSCDGYTNSIYTISVSAATSIGLQPWYLESCASTLISAYSTGSSKTEKPFVTADLSSGCTNKHTGTSVSPPLIAGFIALALEVNPNLTWRDVQHLLVETSSLDNLIADDFHLNGVGKKFSHHFGYGMVNGAELVALAEKWPTVSEQRQCHHFKEIQKFPHNRFNQSSPLILEINSTACKGAPQHIKYVEHVQIRTTLYHYRRGATEILIVSPMQTRSWVLREREKDKRGGEFSEWEFLSTHFWGEDPTGTWKVIFFSKQMDEYGQGFLQKMTLVLFGTEHKPGERRKDDPIKKPYKCHSECKMGCNGPESNNCNKCQHYTFYSSNSNTYCVQSCPSNSFTIEKSMSCLPCHPTCLTCTNANRTHCISCPSDLSLHEGSCKKTCPERMYRAVDAYKDKSFICKGCEERCTSCYGKSYNCSSCDRDSVLQGSTCVAKCAKNQWLNNDTCQLCHSSCKTCNGGSHLNCTTCAKIALNDLEDRFLYKGSECLLSCPLGFYKDNTIMENCLGCPKHCLQCSNEGRHCDVCDVSYFRLTSGDGACVKKCLPGYYTDLVRRVCESCDPHCTSCVPGKPSACTSCANGYFLKDHECVSISECNTRYYVNNTSGKCSFCPARCTTCKSEDSCIGCFFNYFHTPSDRCEERCPSGTFPHDRTSECETCNVECSECEGPTSSDCTACPLGKTLHKGVCMHDVPTGYFAYIGSDAPVLKSCHHTCKTCIGSSPKDCLTCIDGLDKRENGCFNPCPGQYLSENNCQNCHPSCKSCFGPSINNCLECHNNVSLNVDTYTCSKACHRRFYKDSKSFTCKPCHQKCASCFGPNANQCLTCPDKLHFHNNTCVWQCPSGWYKTFGQVCAPCSTRCKKCLYKYDFCTHCHPDEVWNDYKCFKDCGPKKFHDESRRCLPCHNSCFACKGTAPNECTACKEGMTLHKGMCLPGCLPGYYNSSIVKKCVPCTKDCLQCQETIGEDTQCIVCSNTAVLMPNGKCGEECPLSSYRVPTDNRCGLCPGKGCKECQKPLGKSCTTCMPLFELSNGLCKSTCGVGRYPDVKMKQCFKCDPLCFSCDGPTWEHCKRCSKNAVIMISLNKKITCLSKCPQGFFALNKVCTPCDKSCTECNSASNCTACQHPLLLHQQSCVEQCPERYFSNEKEAKCISCIKRFGLCTQCNASTCQKCDTDSYKLQHKCVNDCGSGFAKSNGSCVECNNLFTQCLDCNQAECTLCKGNYSLFEGECVLKCASGYRFINGSCNKCDDKNCTDTLVSTASTEVRETHSKAETRTFPTEQSKPITFTSTSKTADIRTFTTDTSRPITSTSNSASNEQMMTIQVVATTTVDRSTDRSSDDLSESETTATVDLENEGSADDMLDISDDTIADPDELFNTTSLSKDILNNEKPTIEDVHVKNNKIFINTKDKKSEPLFTLDSKEEETKTWFTLEEGGEDLSTKKDNLSTKTNNSKMIDLEANEQPKRSKRSIADNDFFEEKLLFDSIPEGGDKTAFGSIYITPLAIILLVAFIIALLVWQGKRQKRYSRKCKKTVLISEQSEPRWVSRKLPTADNRP